MGDSEPSNELTFFGLRYVKYEELGQEIENIIGYRPLKIWPNKGKPDIHYVRLKTIDDATLVIGRMRGQIFSFSRRPVAVDFKRRSPSTPTPKPAPPVPMPKKCQVTVYVDAGDGVKKNIAGDMNLSVLARESGVDNTWNAYVVDGDPSMRDAKMIVGRIPADEPLRDLGLDGVSIWFTKEHE